MTYNSENISDLTDAKGGKFKCSSLVEAYQFTEKLALSHYENFPVGSFLIPKKFRKHIYSIYSYARIADDIADENLNFSNEQKLDLLDKFQSNLKIKETTNPLFLALFNTIDELSIPIIPFENLIEAFKMDIQFKQPENFEDLIHYCQRSANPVGELVLRVFDEFNHEKSIYSDNICTGLQLANFWQDISVDIKKNRIYIPQIILKKFEIVDIFNEPDTDKIFKCLNELYVITEQYFAEGKKLIPLLQNYRLRLEINATLAGGQMILSKTKDLKNEILIKRPNLSKSDLFKIFLKTIFE